MRRNTLLRAPKNFKLLGGILDKGPGNGYFKIVGKGPIAQLEEPPAHNRKVPGSNPGGPTRLFKMTIPNTPEATEMDRPLEKASEAEIKKCTPRGAFLFSGGRNCGINWKS